MLLHTLTAFYAVPWKTYNIYIYPNQPSKEGGYNASQESVT